LPIFKGQGCKSAPGKAINYITREDKADLVSSLSLDDGQSYAGQFRDTATLYGKGNNYDERKYYHFKFSCDPADGVTAAQSQLMAEQMAAMSFPGHECVIATHTDKAHIHSHIIVNAVSFEDGKKLHINDNEYATLKDLANEIAQAYGFTPLDWRKRSQDRITSSEKQIVMRGGISWKDELKDVISKAAQRSDSFIAFRNHLEQYGVTIERNTERTISYKHPDKAKAIRGERLGEAFTKGAIVNGINQLSHRRTRTGEEPAADPDRKRKITSSQRAEQGRAGKQPTQGEFDRVHGSIREIEERAKRLSATGRAELAERERQERATNTEPTGANVGVKGRQRAAKQKHERGYSGHDFGR
jgi:hypothetical protein